MQSHELQGTHFSTMTPITPGFELGGRRIPARTIYGQPRYGCDLPPGLDRGWENGMKYLTLSADCEEPGLRDDAVDGRCDLWDELSLALRGDIAGWNDSYQAVVQMSADQRVEAADLIGELDTCGVRLAARVAAELSPAKVRYYSEGLLRPLL